MSICLKGLLCKDYIIFCKWDYFVHLNRRLGEVWGKFRTTHFIIKLFSFLTCKSDIHLFNNIYLNMLKPSKNSEGFASPGQRVQRYQPSATVRNTKFSKPPSISLHYFICHAKGSSENKQNPLDQCLSETVQLMTTHSSLVLKPFAKYLYILHPFEYLRQFTVWNITKLHYKTLMIYS